MRLDLVDGIRGHLLIGMLIAHLSFRDGMGALGLFHHYHFIHLYDAEFFIPISGFIIGYLFIERLKSTARFYKFIKARLRTIYPYYLLSAVPFILSTIAGDGRNIFGLLAGILTMQDGGLYSDILPIYFYCFLILYAFLWMIPRTGLAGPLIISGIIYCVSQSSYSTGMFGLSSRFVVFDVAAWQFLLVLFIFIGAHYRRVLDIIERMSSRAYLIVFAMLAVLFLIGRQVDAYPTPFAGYESAPINWPRMQLHPFYLVKILLVSALICAPLVRPDGILSWPSKFMRWYFSLSILRNVGKYSIQSFTVHVFLVAIFIELSDNMSLASRYMFAISIIMFFVAMPNIWVSFRRRRAVQAA